jgi:hypothetical protein
MEDTMVPDNDDPVDVNADVKDLLDSLLVSVTLLSQSLPQDIFNEGPRYLCITGMVTIFPCR